MKAFFLCIHITICDFWLSLAVCASVIHVNIDCLILDTVQHVLLFLDFISSL